MLEEGYYWVKAEDGSIQPVELRANSWRRLGRGTRYALTDQRVASVIGPAVPILWRPMSEAPRASTPEETPTMIVAYTKRLILPGERTHILSHGIHITTWWEPTPAGATPGAWAIEGDYTIVPLLWHAVLPDPTDAMLVSRGEADGAKPVA